MNSKYSGNKCSNCHIMLCHALALTIALLLSSCSSSGNNDEPASGENMVNGNGLANSLTVVSWGGLYEQSQIRALHEPWSNQTGIPVNSISYTGSLDALRQQVQSDQVDWDIIDLEVGEALAACEEGLIDPIDTTRLQAAPDGTPATADFFPGTLFDCAVANIVWSNVIVYNTNTLTSAPTTIADFFDTTNFPGKRGIRQSPRVILEMALLADGVAPDTIYSTLQTDAGITRAFNQLDKIKNDIVWWNAGAESIDILNDQTVSMGTTYNARAFAAIHAEQSSLSMLWDGQVWDLDVWALPAGSTRRETAYSFLALATSTENLADQASYIAYGPPRRSSQSLVGLHSQLGIDMKPYMPTAPENLQNALQFDTAFWNSNGAELEVRFNSWREDM